MIGKNSWTLFNVYVVTTAVILSLFYRDIDTCSCFASHPQVLFCNSQFVVRAIITSPANIIKHTDGKTEWTTKQHSLTILHFFRGEKAITSHLLNKNVNNLSDVNITTPPSGSLCGVHLNYTKSYLIFGQIRNNKLEVNLCNFIAGWESVASPVIRGIHGDYDCRCKIETRSESEKEKPDISKEVEEIPTPDGEKEEEKSTTLKTKSTCYWDMYPDEPVDECGINYATCRKLINPMIVDNKAETCVWIEGPEYQDCKVVQYNNLP